MLRQLPTTQPATRVVDAPVTGHDGRFWPLFRGDMVTADHIRDRMAEDMLTHLTEYGEGAGVTEGDLARLGWNIEQIRAHGGPASERITVLLAKSQARRFTL